MPPAAATNGPTADPLLRELTGAYVDLILKTHFPATGELVRGEVALVPERKVWETLAQDNPYRLRLTVVRDTGRVPVWTADFPVRQGSQPFQIGRALSAGRYWVEAYIVAPGGTAHPVTRDLLDSTPVVPLVVAPPRNTLLQANVRDASALLIHAILLGSPNRERFPKDDKADCQARSVWDLQGYGGRIYVGCGDWYANRGPIDIWSFEPTRDGAQPSFTREFTVDEESVDLLRAIEDRLYVPGTDGRESWDFGSLYIKADGVWTKHRTLPNAVHVFDAALYRGKLFVTAATAAGAALFASADGGRTWERSAVDLGAMRFYEIAPLAGGLFLMSWQGNQGAFLYRGGKLERLLIPLFPGLQLDPQRTALRLLPFADGVVYTLRPPGAGPLRSDGQPRPLFYLTDLRHGAVVVEPFRDALVTDILVQEGTCYVLTARERGDGFEGAVFSSRDLKRWTRLAVFEVAAVPNALERVGGRFYVGLANRARDAADAASGAIYVLQ